MLFDLILLNKFSPKLSYRSKSQFLRNLQSDSNVYGKYTKPRIAKTTSKKKVGGLTNKATVINIVW